jgi:protocatechuate 3,4-dioxygenase beta subunit
MIISVLIGAAVWLAQQPAQPPAPEPRVASVEGTVVNALNAQGMARATVILQSRDTTEGISYAEETDANGHFRIDDVAPGEYSISANRQGFFLQPNGAPGAPMPRMKVTTGEQVTNVVVKLAPTGVIAGRVLDQDGEPIRGGRVVAMQYFNIAGKPQLRSVSQVQSNGKGEYRLFGLWPGTYRLQVSSRTTRALWMDAPDVRGPRAPMGYATTFFPSAADVAGAVPVELRAGAELHGFDITVRAAEAAHKVRAKYAGANNVAYQFHLFPADVLITSYGQTTTSNGEMIEFLGVAPGSYVLRATRTENGTSTYAWQTVEVRDDDVDAGTLAFSPPAEIKGTVRIEGKPAAPVQALKLTLQPTGHFVAGVPSPEVKPDGSFVLNQVVPDIYQIALTGADGLYVKSIRLGDEELPDRRLDATRGAAGPLTVVLGSDVGQIEGSVVLADGNPAARVRVTLFPDGASSGRSELFKVVFTDDQGKFHFDKVAPAEYRLFAWQDVQPGGPQDPELRKKFEKQSVTLKLASNGHETVPLTAIVTKTDEPR